MLYGNLTCALSFPFHELHLWIMQMYKKLILHEQIWGCLLKRLINLGRPASLKNCNMYVFSSRLRWSHVLGNEIVFYNRISTMFVCLKENHGKNSGSELQNFSVNNNANSFAALGDKRHAKYCLLWCTLKRNAASKWKESYKLDNKEREIETKERKNSAGHH